MLHKRHKSKLQKYVNKIFNELRIRNPNVMLKLRK